MHAKVDKLDYPKTFRLKDGSTVDLRLMTKDDLKGLLAFFKELPEEDRMFLKEDVTQPQLVAILALRQFFKTDYRGTVQFLRDFSQLRSTLKLKKIPHYSTLCYAEGRLVKKGSSQKSVLCFV